MKNLLSIHKYIIGAVGIAHLALTPLHINGLIITDEQICGFYMFMFVLVGLACVFNATRIESDLKWKDMILSTICLVVTMVFGILLSITYMNGIIDGKVDRDVTNIIIAFAFSCVVLAADMAGLVLLWVSKLVKKG